MSLAAALKPLSPLFPLSLFLCGRMSYDMRKLDCVCWNWFILTGFLQFSFNSSITIKKKSKWDLEQRAKWFYSEFEREPTNKQKIHRHNRTHTHRHTFVIRQIHFLQFGTSFYSHLLIFTMSLTKLLVVQNIEMLFWYRLLYRNLFENRYSLILMAAVIISIRLG